MRRPVDPNLNRTTRGTAKPGQPHRDLTEQRGYRMTPVVLHVTRAHRRIDTPVAERREL